MLAAVPPPPQNRSYTVVDATPLYIGQGRGDPVTYNPRHW